MYMEQAYVYMPDTLRIITAVAQDEKQSDTFRSYLESIECKDTVAKKS